MLDVTLIQSRRRFLAASVAVCAGVAWPGLTRAAGYREIRVNEGGGRSTGRWCSKGRFPSQITY